MENRDILEKQEKLLQFEQFDSNEALKLGNFMMEYAKKNSITIAISIRSNSGCILFQHCPNGTNLLNQKWMERKFNTVRLMEKSSLQAALEWEDEQCTTQTHGLKDSEYALCGGGFPIRIKGLTVPVGAVIASNLYHMADHEFIIDCLRAYLNCSEVPSYPFTM